MAAYYELELLLLLVHLRLHLHLHSLLFFVPAG